MGGRDDVSRPDVEDGVVRTTIYVRNSSTVDVDSKISGEDPPKNGLDSKKVMSRDTRY